MDAVLLLIAFFVFVGIGAPIAYAMGMAALFGAFWIGIPYEAVMIKISDGIAKFSLLAIPFFVLAGAIMAEGGMARRLVSFANVLVGFVRGGLALVNIVASTFFAGISGSSVADTSAIGSVLIPQMVKAGYPRLFAVNVTISGSLQALLIPPSHNMVLYSLAAGGSISVGALFLAGVVPGLLLGASLMLYVLFISYKNGYPKGEPIPLRQAIGIAGDALWGLGTMVIILGGILSGVFTATESAAVACIYSFLVTMFVYRDYKWNELPHLLHRVVKTVAMVMMLIAFASAFGYIVALMQLPARATNFFLTLSDNKYAILMMINVLLLVLGCLMDMAPLILICTPILLPVIKSLGVDPVHFGIMLIVNLGIGLLTPPVGSVLFVGCAVGKVTIEQVTRTIWPFYIVMFAVLMLVTYVPAISLWMPRMFGL
jgi:tripartite ATP-independent transporter DctM subunit